MSLEFEGDTKELAEKTLALTQDNNRILHSMQRRARWGFVFRVFYWLVIIGIAIGAFYYIQPYIEPLIKSYQNIQETQAKLGNFSKSVGEYFQKNP